jgi:hypothetical protein
MLLAFPASLAYKNPARFFSYILFDSHQLQNARVN